MEQQAPGFPGPVPSSPEEMRRTLQTMRSTHALDAVFDKQEEEEEKNNAPPLNKADQALDDREDLPSFMYREFDAQKPLNRTDRNAHRQRDYKWLAVTILRGRAMPFRALLCSVIWSTAAVLITWRTSKGYTAKDGECRWWCTPLAVDSDALSYVGFALFLLTSFRVEEAYGRYMEAVRTWTNIAGTVTSMAKYIVQAFPRGAFHKGDRERILSFLVAFPVALKRELRGERDLRELKTVLARSDLARLQQAESMSAYCLYVLSSYALHFRREEGRLPQTFVIQIIGWIADLSGCASVCTQIRTMPAPYSYITHLNTFLALWLLFLPFAMVETTGWGTIVIVAFIAYGLLGVVANAAELEDPFGSDYNDLPLGRIAEGIQEQVLEIYRSGFIARTDIVCHVPDPQLHESGEFWLDAEKARPAAPAALSDSALDIDLDVDALGKPAAGATH